MGRETERRRPLLPGTPEAAVLLRMASGGQIAPWDLGPDISTPADMRRETRRVLTHLLDAGLLSCETLHGEGPDEDEWTVTRRGLAAALVLEAM